jgi:hypothetical protein
MIKKGLLIFFVLICAFFAFKTNAQIQSGDIVFSISPKYPKANENVNASVSTYTIDLNSARISWILNGETKIAGVGKKNFSFNVGNSSFQTILEVKIETISGATINKKITISPSDVDMLWEAYNGYVPPFYKGKALASTEGSIKVVAVPSSQNLAGFNYKWKEDNKSKQDSSGYEKNYFIYKNSYLEDVNNIDVSVSDLFGNDIGTGNTSITPGNPKILFYKKDQILGTKWENALTDGHTISTDGDIIVAEPYFFSNKDLTSSGYEFKWSLNGEDTMIPDQKNILAIKPEAGKSGNTAIKVIINNTKTLFQSMEKTLNVNF